MKYFLEISTYTDCMSFLFLLNNFKSAKNFLNQNSNLICTEDYITMIIKLHMKESCQIPCHNSSLKTHHDMARGEGEKKGNSLIRWETSDFMCPFHQTK